MSAIDALILAGSRGPNDPVAALGGVPHKALTPIAGRPMLAFVLDAVRGVPEVDRIFICIDAETDLRPVTNGTTFNRIPPAASPAATAASISRAATNCRSSIPSASKASRTNAAPCTS